VNKDVSMVPENIVDKIFKGAVPQNTLIIRNTVSEEEFCLGCTVHTAQRCH
jgi:hypothetical protein